ncbi:prolipoprotein diacylglyceryl transferase [Neisseria sp. Ec49-e6-T10]|uniref:prolipoprotein diacylglyceryl transferase n=1 Tax=Neisseria sp. Ec49-e6-T10 TaxID=3140744 RepID=UPI003EBD608D
MIIHPQFDPVLLSIGPISIRWYALSYIIGFCLFMVLGRHRIKKGLTFLTNKLLDDLLFWGVLGVILGGRLGFVLFYQPEYYFSHPGAILEVWKGGMSFHGGFLGVLVAIFFFAKRQKRSFFEVSDFVAPLVPLGLASGRLGNFINGELWGRVTSVDAWWAMGFPQAQSEDLTYISTHADWVPIFLQHNMLPRHPSQLYQMVLEGICLFLILWFFSKKPRPIGQTSALFLTGYGLFRFIAEFAREPDEYLGLLSLGLSMGQWLSLPMIVFGIGLFIYFGKRNIFSKTT